MQLRNAKARAAAPGQPLAAQTRPAFVLPQVLRQRDHPEYKYTLGFVGYGPEEVCM